MATPAQIEQFKREARRRGIPEAVISNTIAKNMTRNAKTAVTFGGSKPLDLTKPTPGLDFNNTPTPKPGLVRNIVNTVTAPAKRFGEFALEAGAQGVRAAVDPNISFANPLKREQRFVSDDLDQQAQSLFQQERELIAQAKQTKDKKERDRLIKEARKLRDAAEVVGNRAGQIAQQPTTFLEDEEDLSGRGKILETGARRTAGAASYVIPAGKTIKAASGFSALSGGMFSFSEDGAGVDDVLMGTVGGGIGGATIPLAIRGVGKTKNLISGGYKKLFTKPSEFLSDAASQRINKASPSMWQKAVEDHGIDLNKLTAKFVRKLKPKFKGVPGKGGVSYDDLLGPVSDRGRGGLFKTEMEAAEGVIKKALKNVNKNTKFTIDEIVQELNKEKIQLAKLEGNQSNIAALDEFIKGIQAQYGSGITPRRALELKRIADSQFGRAVTDENTGGAVAQAQKMVANALRRKLKDLIPEIADALDTETELYTIQPILSRARATLQTQGSGIRVGSLRGKSITDLLNPINWFDWYLSDPKRASEFIGKSSLAQEIKRSGQREINGLNLWNQLVGRLTGTTIALDQISQPGEEIQKQQQQYARNNTQQEQEGGDVYSQGNQLRTPFINRTNQPTDNQQDYSDPIQNQRDNDYRTNNIQQESQITPPTDLLTDDTESLPQSQAFPTKQEFLREAVMNGARMEDLDRLEAMYDRFAPQEVDIDSLLARREKLQTAGYDTSTIDNQLSQLGYSKAEKQTSDLITQINSLSSVGERQGARATKDILDVVDSAIKTFGQGVDTGPLSAAKSEASKLTTPNKTAQLEKDLKEILRTIRKESTGVAFSPEEIKELLKEIPSIMQQEGNVDDSLKRLRVRMLQKLLNYGIDVTSYTNN